MVKSRHFFCLDNQMSYYSFFPFGLCMALRQLREMTGHRGRFTCSVCMLGWRQAFYWGNQSSSLPRYRVTMKRFVWRSLMTGKLRLFWGAGVKPSLNAALIVSLINHVSSKFCAHLASVCLYGIVRLHSYQKTILILKYGTLWNQDLGLTGKKAYQQEE